MPGLIGLFTPAEIMAEQPKSFRASVQSAFVDRFMVATRLTRRPEPAEKFSIYTHGPRPKVLALGADIAADDTTTITLSDVVGLLQGDVLAIGAERVEINGAITVTNTATGEGTVVVVRGVEGTTPANSTSSASTHSDEDEVRLIGNSRNGAEVDQPGYRIKRRVSEQFIQTFQFPVQVGGRAAASAAMGGFVLPPGGDARTPGGGPLMYREEEDKLTDMLLDVEDTTFYGIGEDGETATTKRWKQRGLRTFASLVGNLNTNPTNKAAYKPVDMQRDVVQAIRAKKGNIDLLICSEDFDLAFSAWGQAAQALPAGATEFGTPITVYRTGIFPRLAIWYSQALRPGTIVGVDSQRVRMAVKRDESYMIRGRRGDAYEGDWVCDMAVEIEDPDQGLVWVEGITDFAPASGMS